jgi:hypothetical protein
MEFLADIFGRWLLRSSSMIEYLHIEKKKKKTRCYILLKFLTKKLSSLLSVSVVWAFLP